MMNESNMCYTLKDKEICSDDDDDDNGDQGGSKIESEVSPAFLPESLLLLLLMGQVMIMQEDKPRQEA